MDEVQVIAHGAIFDGRAEAAVEEMIGESVRLVAVAAEEAVDRNLAASIRHPGSPPFYQSQINIAHRGLAEVVNDNMVIYGPWLEGVGSKNKTTRFKGYASFRRAKQEIDAKVSAIMQPAMTRFLAAVNKP